MFKSIALDSSSSWSVLHCDSIERYDQVKNLYACTSLASEVHALKSLS